MDIQPPEIRIVSAADPAARAALSRMIIDIVADGSSVTFMHPLAPETAEAFWDGALSAAARGEKLVLGAWEGGELVGTVTVHLDCPQNQPHRAEIAKLMTRLDRRGQGIARALMLAAEREAAARGKTLLVLDTAEDGGAGRLYEALGYQLAGRIPDFAFKPHGGLTGTLIYYRRL